jgi:hypothetical protein
MVFQYLLYLLIQEPRRGAHGRASRMRKISLNWSAEGGPRDPVLPRCVLILLLFRVALIGKATGGLYAKEEVCSFA